MTTDTEVNLGRVFLSEKPRRTHEKALLWLYGTGWQLNYFVLVPGTQDNSRRLLVF